MAEVSIFDGEKTSKTPKDSPTTTTNDNYASMPVNKMSIEQLKAVLEKRQTEAGKTGTQKKGKNWISFMDTMSDEKLTVELKKLDKFVNWKQRFQEKTSSAAEHHVRMFPLTEKDLSNPFLLRMIKLCRYCKFNSSFVGSDGKQAWMLTMVFLKFSDAKKHFPAMQNYRDDVQVIRDQSLKIARSKPVSVFAPSLAQSIIEEDLIELFPTAKQIALIDAVPRKHAYIDFDDAESLQNAVDALNAVGPSRKDMSFCGLLRADRMGKLMWSDKSPKGNVSKTGEATESKKSNRKEKKNAEKYPVKAQNKPPVPMATTKRSPEIKRNVAARDGNRQANLSTKSRPDRFGKPGQSGRGNQPDRSKQSGQGNRSDQGNWSSRRNQSWQRGGSQPSQQWKPGTRLEGDRGRNRRNNNRNLGNMGLLDGSGRPSLLGMPPGQDADRQLKRSLEPPSLMNSDGPPLHKRLHQGNTNTNSEWDDLVGNPNFSSFGDLSSDNVFLRTNLGGNGTPNTPHNDRKWNDVDSRKGNRFGGSGPTQKPNLNKPSFPDQRDDGLGDQYKSAELQDLEHTLYSQVSKSDWQEMELNLMKQKNTLEEEIEQLQHTRNTFGPLGMSAKNQQDILPPKQLPVDLMSQPTISRFSERTMQAGGMLNADGDTTDYSNIQANEYGGRYGTSTSEIDTNKLDGYRGPPGGSYRTDVIQDPGSYVSPNVIRARRGRPESNYVASTGSMDTDNYGHPDDNIGSGDYNEARFGSKTGTYGNRSYDNFENGYGGARGGYP